MTKTLLILLLFSAISALPLRAAAEDSDALELSDNFIVNGDAENPEAPLFGWQVSPQLGVGLHLGEIGIDSRCSDLGERFFTMAAQPLPARQAFMQQRINLRGFGSRTFLATACILTKEGDLGRLELAFFDRQGRLLSKVATPLSAAPEWRAYRLSGRIPRRADFARVTLRGKDRYGDRIVDVEVDNISFRIVSLDDSGTPSAVCGKIPPGHLPPPGQCRIWFPGRPPGHQPPPGPCDELKHAVPPGACIVYG